MTTTNTCNSTFKIKIPSRFDEKDQVEGADETKQNAENVLTAITCVNLPKIKTVHRFDEKDQVEEADETEQNAENVLTAITCVNLPKIKTAHKFDEVTAERDKTEELYVEQQNAVHTALASHKYFENNHTALKIISVQVATKDKRDVSNKNTVEFNNTTTAGLNISVEAKRETRLRQPEALPSPPSKPQ